MNHKKELQWSPWVSGLGASGLSFGDTQAGSYGLTSAGRGLEGV